MNMVCRNFITVWKKNLCKNAASTPPLFECGVCEFVRAKESHINLNVALLSLFRSIIISNIQSVNDFYGSLLFIIYIDCVR